MLEAGEGLCMLKNGLHKVSCSTKDAWLTIDSLRDVIFSYLKAWKGYIDTAFLSIFASADGLLSLIFIRPQSLQEKREHLVQIPETGFSHCNVTF